ncbi:MAG: hypothetical protein OXH65_05675 [Paracoccaceae bacterium]|nr:hypothetical protein [Paracoccaceae bacterium]
MTGNGRIPNLHQSDNQIIWIGGKLLLDSQYWEYFSPNQQLRLDAIFHNHRLNQIFSASVENFNYSEINQKKYKIFSIGFLTLPYVVWGLIASNLEIL